MGNYNRITHILYKARTLYMHYTPQNTVLEKYDIINGSKTTPIQY